jgi:hypothetical protein
LSRQDCPGSPRSILLAAAEDFALARESSDRAQFFQGTTAQDESLTNGFPAFASLGDQLLSKFEGF